ncbi:MAG: hypothetical protein M1132_10275 [Chloroflexi bacterium]|nr:hypothetical protein [Chloroflexota bacterium]MCL5952085.1 hypothetical protein [Chloroflexota bacterium]
MRTPYGKECRYYFSDYYRGRSTEECRLIQLNRHSEPWRPALCQACPVPDILAANGSPNLVLRATVAKSMFGLLRKVEVTAYCREHRVDIKDPKKGCPQCRNRVASDEWQVAGDK